jgi:acetolactate synthase-1/2/3 large subunit
MNGADIIAEILKREGTEIIAGFPRTPIIESCAALGIRPILARQERVGASIADGYSRQTGGKKIGVFVSQHGPGAENAFPGAAQAFAENVPVLFLPGGDGVDRQYSRPVFNAADSYRTVTKWSAQVPSASRVPALMRRAYHLMRNGRPGPVLLEVLRDAWEDELSGPIDYEPVPRHLSAPDPADVAKAAKMIKAAKRPMILAGQGVLWSDASVALVALAEAANLPVMTTNPGKSAFPEDHALALGASLGRSRPAMAQDFLHSADLVIGIGTSLSRTNFGPVVPGSPKIIHATVDADDVNKDYRVDHMMIGDARLTCEALAAEIGKQKVDEDLRAEITGLKRDWLAAWEKHLASDETPVNQYRVIRDMMNAVDPDNVVITHDSGSPREQLMPFWIARRPRSYMGWGKSTQLGHGLGLIMGAKLAEPEKTCINVMGDAAIGMVGMDLETAARLKIGTITVVFNNGVMAAERDVMVLSNDTFGTLAQHGNYCDVARALGVEAMRVDTPDAFTQSFAAAVEATQSGTPALIEVMAKEGYDFSRF